MFITDLELENVRTFRATNKGRYTQVVHLIDRLLGPAHYTFTRKLERGDYLFERGGVEVPFRALSGGYRAFIGWVGDLLYHVYFGAPPGKKLVESAGIVLVDEIDLHLHPRWQMRAIPVIAKALPRVQFVFTSHSPLVAGSLEWMNIITLKTGNKTNRTAAKRLRPRVRPGLLRRPEGGDARRPEGGRSRPAADLLHRRGRRPGEYADECLTYINTKSLRRLP